MRPIVVLDTSVLVGGLRSRMGASFALLELVGNGKFEIAVTAALVLEYESVCVRHLDAFALTSDDVRAIIDYLCRVAVRVPVRFRLRPGSIDPGDDLVLEAAVSSGSDWIVTHNVRHMAVEAAKYGIDVLRPGEALKRLGVAP